MNDNTRNLHEIKLFTGFITTVLMVMILKELKNIFIPFFVAILLYFLFNGVVKRMLQLKIPKPLVLVFLLIFIFILFYFVGVLLYASVSAFVTRFPAYSGKVLEMLKGLFEQLKIPISEVNDYLNNLDWIKSIDTGAVSRMLTGTLGNFASFVGNLMLVLIFLMFMLAGRDALTGRLNKAFESARAKQIHTMVHSIEDQVQHYLLIKTFTSLLTGLVCGIILFIGGFDFIIFSALLIFILNFIPTVGSVFATAIPVTIGILQFGFSINVVLVGGGLMFTQFIIGNVLEPRITGRSLNLSPIVILMSLIFWGYVWGIIGMMLAVPLTSAIKIFFQNIPTLKPLAELISAD